MGLFSDYKNLPQVGPVRSARDQFFQLILPWEMLYLVFIGHIGYCRFNKNENRTDFSIPGSFWQI